MFIVINKEKIKTYAITLGIVIVAFSIVLLGKNESNFENSVIASTNIEENNEENYTINDANILKIEEKLKNN